MLKGGRTCRFGEYTYFVWRVTQIVKPTPNRTAVARSQGDLFICRTFFQESERVKGINETKFGVSAKLAVAVKIETHGLLAVHTPKSYGH
jgi:hypothetical protein